MKLPRLHRKHSADQQDRLAGADYDAQSDLALPTRGQEIGPGDVANAFGGSVVEPPVDPAYDVHRDTGA